MDLELVFIGAALLPFIVTLYYIFTKMFPSIFPSVEISFKPFCIHNWKPVETVCKRRGLMTSNVVQDQFCVRCQFVRRIRVIVGLPGSVTNVEWETGPDEPIDPTLDKTIKGNLDYERLKDIREQRSGDYK